MKSRIDSLDYYRGFVMLLMMAEVLNIQSLLSTYPNSKLLHLIVFNQSHVEWVGFSLHDLIQPSFSFLVGAALPFSVSSKLQIKRSNFELLLITVRRSIILIFLGIFLRSMGHKITNWTFEDTLTQIGLGYTFLYLIYFVEKKKQLIILFSILVFVWLIYVWCPINENAVKSIQIDSLSFLFNFNEYFGSQNNAGLNFDKWFLNLFPREREFIYNEGGYVTINFLGTLSTMVFGLLAGNVIRVLRDDKMIFQRFSKYGIILILSSLLVHYLGLSPIVKRIWTPSWVLFSAGWCFIFLAIFTWLSNKRFDLSIMTFLKIVGVNSIAAYMIAHLLPEFIINNLNTHFGGIFNQLSNESISEIMRGGIVFFIELVILRWMYAKKIFIKI